jgi:hypothetical protein
MAKRKFKLSEEARAHAREYQKEAYYRKRAKELGIPISPGTSAQENYERYKARAGGHSNHSNQGNKRTSKRDRSRIAKAAWRAKRVAELEDSMPVVHMETTVDVPNDIEPGVMSIGQPPANGVPSMPALPTGVSLMSEFTAMMRKAAITVREIGAEHGVFTMPDGSTFKVRGDGAISTG